MGKPEHPNPFADLTEEQILEKMADVKIKRDELTAKDKPLKEQYDAYGEELMRRLDERGTEGTKSKRASASITEIAVPVVKDVEAFARWALRTKHTHLFTASCVSSPAWREAIELNPKHTPPPGTEVFTKRNLNFRLTK